MRFSGRGSRYKIPAGPAYAQIQSQILSHAIVVLSIEAPEIADIAVELLEVISRDRIRVAQQKISESVTAVSTKEIEDADRARAVMKAAV